MPKNEQKVVAIVQARMGSTRLPGKVLMDLGKVPVLERVLRRVQRAVQVQEVAVATTDKSADRAIVQECERLGVACVCGSEDDVLDRYQKAAKVLAADIVVRITSDCPLIDPQLIDETLASFFDKQADYASNSLHCTYPRGLDAEVFTVAGLQRAGAEATRAYEREHVTPYFYEHPEIFKVIHVTGEADYSHYRWTLDTPEDLQLIRAVYSHMGNRDDFSWLDVIQLMERRPELADLNAHIVQKPLH